MEKGIVFERNKWSTSDGVAQMWVNDLVWNLLRGPRSDLSAPRELPQGMTDVATVCRQAIIHNGLTGLVPHVYEDKLRKTLSSQFYDRIETDRRRTEIFQQELQMLFGPTMFGRMVPIEGAAVRRVYAKKGEKVANPRFVPTLVIWAPTLTIREEITTLLIGGGYVPASKKGEGYSFAKSTMGVSHAIQLKGVLWESSKNWTSDVERGIWDRAQSNAGQDGAMQFDLTDLFILTCRHFAVDTLCGGGVELLDLIKVLQQAGDNLDWSRIKEIKDHFTKPDWLWAALIAVVFAEQKTGLKLELADWARNGVRDLKDSFYYSFIESRLNWACPDARLVDFSRAYVKLAMGT